MFYIEQVIGPDERLIGVSEVHWIYGAVSLCWLFAGVIFSLTFDFVLTKAAWATNIPVFLDVADALSFYTFWTMSFIGIVVFLFYVTMMLTTELALTTKRVIYKRGWLFVDVKEVDLEEIKAADVDTGILGRFLNYGSISLDARFVTSIILPAIDTPYKFLKAMNEIRSLIKTDSLKSILEDKPPQGVPQPAPEEIENITLFNEALNKRRNQKRLKLESFTELRSKIMSSFKTTC